MTFNYTRIIPNPLRNFVKRYTSARKKAAERPAHGVWRHPCKTAPFGVLLERSGKIVTITIYPMSHVGLEHVWLPQTIVLYESEEGGGERYGAFLPVFEVDRARLAEMQESGT